MAESEIKIRNLDGDDKEHLDDITHTLIEDIFSFSKDKSLSIMEMKMILNDADEDYGSDETIDIKVVFRVTSSYIENKLENKYGYYTRRDNKKH